MPAADAAPETTRLPVEAGPESPAQPAEPMTAPPRTATVTPAPARPAGRRRTGAGWAALALFVVAIAGAGFVLQDEIVAAWPPAARAYASLGLRAAPAPDDLGVRNLAYERRGTDGVVVLEVTGEIVNTGSDPRDVPRLRVTLQPKDAEEETPVARIIRAVKGGEPPGTLASWTFRADQAWVAPGASVKFRTSMERPPSDPITLGIGFVTD